MDEFNKNKFDKERYDKQRYRYRNRPKVPAGLAALTIFSIILISILVIGSSIFDSLFLIVLAYFFLGCGAIILSFGWIIYFIKLTADKTQNNDKNWWVPIIGVAILIFVILWVHNEFFLL